MNEPSDNPPRLSVAIIARNEARHIGDAIRSVAGLADEVLVLDAQSADATVAIARAAGAQVAIEPWRGFPAQRNRALDLCRGEWVLFLDADERVTDQLAAEIAGLLSQDKQLTDPATSQFHAGYWIPRHNVFFGRPLRGGGWYPDRQLRLLRRQCAHYDEARQIHEYADLNGSAGSLYGHLIHLNIERLDELWRKQTAYAIQEAQTLFRAGRRTRWRNFVGAPLREFWRRFVQLGGWRDGWLGVFLCATLAYFEIIKFVHLKGLAYIGEPGKQGNEEAKELPRTISIPPIHNSQLPTLAIIIVSWNTRDLLKRCIQSVHASLRNANIAYQVIVVDNASHDGTPTMLRAEHPEVTLLETGSNLGFAGGNNVALRLLLTEPTSGEQQSMVDYILLLNPDTEVVGDAIPQLVRFLEQHPAVALAGPLLRYPDGSVQPSRRRFPSPGVFFWESTPLETRWPHNPWARRYRMADVPDTATQPVDWLVGAALLVRREAVARAGLLDEGFAMYSEELEWQQRIGEQAASVGRQLKDKSKHQASSIRKNQVTRFNALFFLPSATIIHHEGQSSAQAPARRYINFHRSRLRYARMRYGRWFAAAVRVFLLAVYSAELATEAAKWLLGHKRPLRAERVRVYWQLLGGLAT